MPRIYIPVSIPDKSNLFLLRYLFPNISFSPMRDTPPQIVYVPEGAVPDPDASILLLEDLYGIRFPGRAGIRALVERAQILSEAKLERFLALESEDSVWLCRALAELRDTNRITKPDETGGVSLTDLLSSEYGPRIQGLMKYSRPDRAVSKLMSYLVAAKSSQELVRYGPRHRDRILSIAARLNVAELQAYHYDPEHPQDSLLELSLIFKGR
jgi:hypothetical protein